MSGRSRGQWQREIRTSPDNTRPRLQIPLFPRRPLRRLLLQTGQTVDGIRGIQQKPGRHGRVFSQLRAATERISIHCAAQDRTQSDGRQGTGGCSARLTSSSLLPKAPPASAGPHTSACQPALCCAFHSVPCRHRCPSLGTSSYSCSFLTHSPNLTQDEEGSTNPQILYSSWPLPKTSAQGPTRPLPGRAAPTCCCRCRQVSSV